MKNVNWQAIYNHLCFFNIKELVTNLLYIFHILITPSAIIYDCIYNHRTTKTNQKYPSVNL